MEEWKDILGTVNYQVSNMGNIRNKSTLKILKGRLSKAGYLQVSIKYSDTNKFSNAYIHRLVALNWINNPENKETVNHINGNKLDNRVENLEWMTNTEQQLHRHNMLNQHNEHGKQLGQFTIHGDLIQIFPSVIAAAKFLDKSRVNIDNAIHHKKNQQTAYGYIWKYIE